MYILIPYTIVVILVGCLLNGMAFVAFTFRGNKTGFKSNNANYNLYLGALSIWDTCTLIFNFAVGVMRALSPKVNAFYMRTPILCSSDGVVVEFFNLQSAWTIVSFSVERLLTTYLPFKFTPKNQEPRFFKVMTYFFITNLFFSSLKLLVSGFEGNSAFGYPGCKRINIIGGTTTKPFNSNGYNYSHQHGNYTLRAPRVMSADFNFKAILYILVGLNTWLPVICVLTCNILIVRKIWSNRNRIHPPIGTPVGINTVARLPNSTITTDNPTSVTSLPNQVQQPVQTNVKENKAVPNEGEDNCGRSNCDTELGKEPDVIGHSVALPKSFLNPLLKVKEILFNRGKGVKTVASSSSTKESRATKLLLLVSTAHLISITPLGVSQILELVWSTSPFFTQFVKAHPDILANTKKARIILFALYQLTFATNFIWYLIFPSNKSFRRFPCPAKCF
ncbi:unnamed protein product [Gordionus sp. m RMFG-2023]